MPKSPPVKLPEEYTPEDLALFAYEKWGILTRLKKYEGPTLPAFADLPRQEQTRWVMMACMTFGLGVDSAELKAAPAARELKFHKLHCDLKDL